MPAEVKKRLLRNNVAKEKRAIQNVKSNVVPGGELLIIRRASVRKNVAANPVTVLPMLPAVVLLRALLALSLKRPALDGRLSAKIRRGTNTLIPLILLPSGYRLK